MNFIFKVQNKFLCCLYYPRYHMVSLILTSFVLLILSLRWLSLGNLRMYLVEYTQLGSKQGESTLCTPYTSRLACYEAQLNRGYYLQLVIQLFTLKVYLTVSVPYIYVIQNSFNIIVVNIGIGEPIML